MINEKERLTSKCTGNRLNGFARNETDSPVCTYVYSSRKITTIIVRLRFKILKKNGGWEGRKDMSDARGKQGAGGVEEDKEGEVGKRGECVCVHGETTLKRQDTKEKVYWKNTCMLYIYIYTYYIYIRYFEAHLFKELLQND